MVGLFSESMLVYLPEGTIHHVWINGIIITLNSLAFLGVPQSTYHHSSDIAWGRHIIYQDISSASHLNYYSYDHHKPNT